MAIPSPPPPMPVRNSPLFVVAYAGWATAVVLWAVRSMASGSDAGGKESAYPYLLIPVLLIAGARWVGTSPRGATIVGRSIVVHLLSPLVPCLLIGIIRASDPGFSAHGGAVLVFFLTVPYMLGLGLVGGLSAWGVVRLLRPSGPGAGDRGAAPGS